MSAAASAGTRADTPPPHRLPRLRAKPLYGVLMSSTASRGPGAPPRNRDRHAYTVSMDPQLKQDLQLHADRMGVSRSAYVDGILAAAHRYSNRWIAEVTGHTPVPMQQVRTYVEQDLRPEHGQKRPGKHPRLFVRADRDLAVQVAQQADRLGATYAEYVMAVLRAALGYPLDPAEWPEQGALEFEREVAS